MDGLYVGSCKLCRSFICLGTLKGLAIILFEPDFNGALQFLSRVLYEDHLVLTVEKIKRIVVKRIAIQHYRTGHTQQAACLSRDVLTQRLEIFLNVFVLYVVHIYIFLIDLSNLSDAQK